MPNFPVTRASADGAVPAGRVGYDLTADRLLLHTIQTAEAFEELLSTGQLIADPRLGEPEFSDAYAWMLRQMDLRLPTSGTSALWFWARTFLDPATFGRRDAVQATAHVLHAADVIEAVRLDPR